MRRRCAIPILLLVTLSTACRRDDATAPHPYRPDAQLAVTTNSRITFQTDRDSNFEVYVINADGSAPTRLTNSPAFDGYPAWSPDGQRIAFRSDRDGDGEIYVMNVDGSGLTRLTASAGPDYQASWSPDGQRIAFTSRRDGNYEIYVMNADGSAPTRLTTNIWTDYYADWSPDGQHIAFTSLRDGNNEIYVMNPDGSAQTRLTTNPAEDYSPSWSPDGSKIAFVSNRDGNYEIYAMNADGSNPIRLTNNTSNDAEPAWSPDGRQIAFQASRDGNNEIYVMNADGSNPVRLTDNAANDTWPAWSPLPATTGALDFVTQPPDTVRGEEPMPAVQVAVRDSLGNVVTGATNAVTLSLADNPTGATLLGTTTVAAVDGIATFSDLRVDHPGSGYTLEASADGLTSAFSNPFTVSYSTKLAFVTQPPGSVASGAVLSPPVQVAVTDSLGNTVSGATNPVTLTLIANPVNNLARATLLGTTTVAAVDGIATFSDLRVDRTGLYVLAATAPEASGDTSGSFAVQPTLTFAVVDVGDDHSCGLTTGGAAYCWGLNYSGQLGDGTTIARTSPVAVSGGLSFTTIKAGGAHSCALTGDGAAYCWGKNQTFALGDGTRTERWTPVAVAGGLHFAALSAGRDHTCGVTTDGELYCWGFNDWGQLGDGTVVPRATPTPVLGSILYASVSAGWIQTCGVTKGGVVMCWGNNFYGQLGDGTPEGPGRPIPGPVLGGVGFASVSAAAYHTCGTRINGAAYCWGSNAYGALGDGTTTNSTTPVAVAGGLTFAEISAGDYHTCGVTTGRTAYCWGSAADGRLGDGSTVSVTPHSSPTPVRGELAFESVASGFSNSCAVTPAGWVYCWGIGRLLGDGTTSGSAIPRQIWSEPGAVATAALRARTAPRTAAEAH